MTDSETAGLAPLGNYGGPTQTMALLPGSPALGTGTAVSGITTDQRGEPLASPVPDIGAFQSQGFVVTITGGNNQTGVVGSSFADPLSVTVTANDPQEPVAGGVVSFTAPASGASASFTGNPAVIGADGSASVSATANSVGGTYAVTASTGAGSASFSLTNVAQPTFSNLAAPTITYGTATATLGGTILAGSFVPTGDVNITVDNVTEQAAIDGSGDFSIAFPTATLGVAGVALHDHLCLCGQRHVPAGHRQQPGAVCQQGISGGHRRQSVQSLRRRRPGPHLHSDGACE